MYIFLWLWLYIQIQYNSKFDTNVPKKQEMYSYIQKWKYLFLSIYFYTVLHSLRMLYVSKYSKVALTLLW